jgi:hypothetical protein
VSTKSKGKARQTQHRNIQRQDSSDTHEDELPRTRDETLSKGKRSIGAPGRSTVTGARPSKPNFGKFNKRPRLSNLEGEKDTVSQQRCQPQGYQLIVQSPGGLIRKHTQTSQSAFMREVSHPPCLSVGCHSLYHSQPHRPAEKSVTPATLHHLYFPHPPLQPLSSPSNLQHGNLPLSRCPLPWGSVLPNLQRSYRHPGQQVPSVSQTGSSNQRSSVSMLRTSNQVALFQQKPV